MRQYLDTLRHVRDNGMKKGDRTGSLCTFLLLAPNQLTLFKFSYHMLVVSRETAEMKLS